MDNTKLVAIRGGGDLATGIIFRLHQAGFYTIALELEHPLVVRRRVAVATAILEGSITIEGIDCRHVHSLTEALHLAQQGIIPVLIAPTLPAFPFPLATLIDARMAKRNLDTQRNQADLVIALGPGFTAGVDCDVVIETMRGHTLGRVIWQGTTLPNTGTPGTIAGKGAKRVLRAPTAGKVTWLVDIGDTVTAHQQLGIVADVPLFAPFAGVVRGLIAPHTTVSANLKIGDIDPRTDVSACFTISDKALAMGGAVLTAILQKQQRPIVSPPTLSLPHAFGFGNQSEIVAIVGGGGKTSLMMALAQALGAGTLTGTTTRIFKTQLAQSPAVVYTNQLDTLDLALKRFGTAMVVQEVIGEKGMGMPANLPAKLLARPDVRHVVVEADGSRNQPCKAPADHEPVIPDNTTLLIPIVGIDALHQPLSQVAHRPHLVQALTGLDEDASITIKALAMLLSHPQGGLKDAPPTARVIPCINKVETPDQLIQARQIARLALQQPRIQQVVIAAVRTPQPVREVHKRVLAVVLAAGQSQRMGQTKQLLPWGDTTILGQTLTHVCASDVHDVVVVTGHETDKVQAIAQVHSVRTLHNPHYAEGEMLSSLQTALAHIDPTIGSVLVILADQPLIPPAIFNQLILAYAQGMGRLLVPTYKGKRGNPVLIDRHYFAELLTLPIGSAPRHLLQRHPSAVTTVPVHSETILQDIDTPNAYHQLRTSL